MPSETQPVINGLQSPSVKPAWQLALTPSEQRALTLVRETLRRRPDYDPAMPHLSIEELNNLIEQTELIITTYQNAMTPITKGQLIIAIADLAEVLQVMPPTDTGLDLYFAVLNDMPAILLRPAVVALLRSHKFSRLPLPADMIKHIKGDWDSLSAALSVQITNKYRFATAINLRHQNERINR
jgi:hypothetical protein